MWFFAPRGGRQWFIWILPEWWKLIKYPLCHFDHFSKGSHFRTIQSRLCALLTQNPAFDRNTTFARGSIFYNGGQNKVCFLKNNYGVVFELRPSLSPSATIIVVVQENSVKKSPRNLQRNLLEICMQMFLLLFFHALV